MVMIISSKVFHLVYRPFQVVFKPKSCYRCGIEYWSIGTRITGSFRSNRSYAIERNCRVAWLFRLVLLLIIAVIGYLVRCVNSISPIPEFQFCVTRELNQSQSKSWGGNFPVNSNTIHLPAMRLI